MKIGIDIGGSHINIGLGENYKIIDVSIKFFIFRTKFRIIIKNYIAFVFNN